MSAKIGVVRRVHIHACFMGDSLARPFQKIKNDFIYYSARVLIFLLGYCPFALAGRLGRGFGACVYFLAGGERRKTLKNIQTAYPGMGAEGEARPQALRVWKSLGQNLFEVVRCLRMSQAEIVSQTLRCEGWENMEKALQRGKGVLVVTGHLGNWELLGASLSWRHPIAAVAQKLYDPRFDSLITKFRIENLRVPMVKRGMALRGILEALKENKLVMMLCDQDTGNDGVFVPFFGKEAWTQSGAARIAQKTGAALVPAFMVRGTDGRFELRVEPEIQIPRTGSKEGDVLEAVRRYTEVIENYVRAYPDQWVWMHERWKTRPAGEVPAS